MRFILATNALNTIDSLRTDYENKKKIDLDETPSIIGLPKFFGGTDVETRKTQITWLRKIKTVLEPNLLKEEDIKNPEQLQAHITATRVMIAACLYVQSQIGSSKRNSALYSLIEDGLGITDENYLDEEDKEICYLAAHRVINSSKIALEECNEVLIKKKMKAFTEKEWKAFSKFLEESCITKKIDNPYTNYPITSITRPLFGACFSSSGLAIGYLLGDTLSNASYLMSPKFKVTTGVGTALYVVCGASTTGVALFAPLIATKLVNTVCSISLAQVLATIMGFLGQGIGLGIGYPLDLTYQLLWKSCSLVSNYYSKQSKTPALTGIRIVDGVPVISGLAIELCNEEIPKELIKQTITIEKDGKVYIGDKLLEDPDTELKESQEVQDKLNEHISIKLDKEEEKNLVL